MELILSELDCVSDIEGVICDGVFPLFDDIDEDNDGTAVVVEEDAVTACWVMFCKLERLLW
jgi:hypothetical protein